MAGPGDTAGRRRIWSVRLAVWPLVVVAGLAAETNIWPGQSPQYIVYDLAVGFTAVFVTLFIWEARPRNPVGPLLLAWSAWFLVSPVRYVDSGLVVCASWVVAAVVPICFGHAILAYPSGRLPGPLDRVVITMAYAIATTLAVVQLLWTPTSLLVGCINSCAARPPLLHRSYALSQDLQHTADWFQAGLGAVFIVLAVRRFVRARPWERHRLLPVAVAAGLSAFEYILVSVIPQSTQRIWDAADIADHITHVAVTLAFLLGVYGSRVERSHVADLLARLGGARTDELQPLLAQLLRDPDLRLLVTRTEVDGGTADEPAGPGRVSTQIRSEDGRLLALLVHDRSVLDDARLLASVVAATRLALENERLQATVRQQLADVRASRARLVQAGDAERRRLERNLHDGAQQRLLSLGVALQLAAQANRNSRRDSQELLQEAQAELAAAIDEMRALARGINPAVLTDHGLGVAVTTLAGRCTVPVDVVTVPTQRLPVSAETTAYYVVAEALQNVAKYAGPAHAVVRIDTVDGHVRVDVSDDGVGGAAITPGGGLRGLHDRVEAVGGRFEVSSNDGHGTRVVAEIPCQ
ncbi:MAG: hypothetical protein QOJ60_870 [Actinomycetota bacterium]|nr:hypothetical protein [Actinomycetota bacterium]